MANLENVKSIMDQYGIPDYIWYPIMMSESGGNPGADTGILPKERSVGLFQINTYAHPQYTVAQLKDPSFNAEVAARDFLRPAYEQVQHAGVSPESQTSYVWRYGIRPEWNMAKDAAIRKKTATFLGRGGQVDFTEIPNQGPMGNQVATSPGGLSSTQQMTRFVVYGVIVLILLIVGLQAVPAVSPQQMLIKSLTGGK